ncbi:hypothetical protein TGFOU_403140 [Toxoplasma gondii FOU]|uniref:Uncharacterized protein n=1 Tax=Toxoplasma gondii FOU TaxID=943167 RepID=A0A086LDX9_TOXGO|nr:hypothetical protein TGFOU_403140 [Toxoplasma gondii FOU]
MLSSAFRRTPSKLKRFFCRIDAHSLNRSHRRGTRRGTAVQRDNEKSRQEKKRTRWREQRGGGQTREKETKSRREGLRGKRIPPREIMSEKREERSRKTVKQTARRRDRMPEGERERAFAATLRCLFS